MAAAQVLPFNDYVGKNVNVELRGVSSAVNGTVLAHDAESNVLLVEEQLQPDTKLPEHLRGEKANYHLILTQNIANISSVGDGNPAFLKLGTVNMERIRNAEAKRLAEHAEMLSRRGVGVSEDAQNIFDALAKTMKCSWQGKNMVVMDVLIQPPYTPEACSGGAPRTLERIKTVLQLERQKLGL